MRICFARLAPQLPIAKTGINTLKLVRPVPTVNVDSERSTSQTCSNMSLFSDEPDNVNSVPLPDSTRALERVLAGPSR